MINRLRKHLYLISIVILIVVFGSGVLFGLNIGSADTTAVQKFLQDSELNTESFIVEQSLLEGLGNTTCSFADTRLNELSYQLGGIGRVLTTKDAETSLGKVNYNILKRKYHMMQIKTYMLFYKYSRQCNMTTGVVLFYYGTDAASVAQGAMLDDLVAKYNIKVFAIQYNYSSELNFFEEYYNVTRTPTLVVNMNTTFSGSAAKEDVEAVLKK